MAVKRIVALSGGKDSTAMALRLAEVEPADYTYLVTPTGNELPEMASHWRKLCCLLGKPLTQVTAHTLTGLIQLQNCLPSNRMRWCTRMLKIEPALEFYRANAPCIAYVGLRADEDADERRGIYGVEIPQRFPMREWGWTEADVWAYLADRGITIPYRTDCAWCYAQRLSQWRRLWQTHPELYSEGEQHEVATGHTFRNPSRDTWPAALSELRERFAAGYIPRGADDQLDLWEEQEHGACRVCTL